MPRPSHFAVLVLTAAVFSACTPGQQQADKTTLVSSVAATGSLRLPPADHDFNAYWYAGLAEISTYDVTQQRYNEERPAEQVNVFVTEDLSRSKQFKLDDPASASDDRVPVLKLNAIRRFHTGIYDYSIMSSVFSPVSGAAALKTTCTIQDWCGQVFFQTNLQPDAMRLRGFSYFETEGDTDESLPITLLEDELWNRIRLDPAKIPVGRVRILPSVVHARLRHRKAQPEEAHITLQHEGDAQVLRLNYSGAWRSLAIRFEASPPHRILGWEEIGEKGSLLSKATLKAVRRSAYWAEHDNVHAPLRDSLRLRF